jgi:ATP-binding cassette subfamily B protein
LIKSFGKDLYGEFYRKHLIDNYKTVEKINFFDSVFSPSVQLMRALVIAAVVVLSADQLKLSGLTVGMVAASIELISNLFAPIETLGMELQNIQQAISGIRRVNEFSDMKEEAPKDARIRAADVIREGEVEIGFAGGRFL